MVDGEVYKTYSIEEDEEIIAEPEPVREGFVFSGWSEIPETMPTHDVTVTGTFVAVPKCAIPIISYEKGQLLFTCDTEGVEFVSEITDADVTQHNSATISLTATYNISVYAKAPNHTDSDIATATLCWIDAEPWAEGTKEAEDNVTEVKAMPVLILAEGNIISVQGAAEGTEVSVYNTAGIKLNSAIANNGITTLNTALTSGSTAIVKIGEKSVKVLVK
jgi:hypothetical protein